MFKTSKWQLHKWMWTCASACACARFFVSFPPQLNHFSDQIILLRKNRIRQRDCILIVLTKSGKIQPFIHWKHHTKIVKEYRCSGLRFENENSFTIISSLVGKKKGCCWTASNSLNMITNILSTSLPYFWSRIEIVYFQQCPRLCEQVGIYYFWLSWSTAIAQRIIDMDHWHRFQEQNDRILL